MAKLALFGSGARHQIARDRVVRGRVARIVTGRGLAAGIVLSSLVAGSLVTSSLVACSSGSTGDGFVEEESDAGTGFGPGPARDGGDSGVTQLPECAEDTKDVFVISEDNVLYRFHPPTLAFTNIGLLRCPTGGATPTSMAVDRSGVAWVRHSDGTIWKVSTSDLSCEATAFVPPATTEGAFFKFGMGFSTASDGSSNETLYLSDNAGAGLAKLDVDTMKLTIVGRYDNGLDGRTSELTGTGSGKLYGFFVDSPGRVAEISKGTASVTDIRDLPGVFAGNAWAFSFYGGDFFVYTSSEGSGGFPRAGTGSDVTRFRPSDGSVEVVKTKIGFKIVGAGVSTCAPTSGPR